MFHLNSDLSPSASDRFFRPGSALALPPRATRFTRRQALREGITNAEDTTHGTETAENTVPRVGQLGLPTAAKSGTTLPGIGSIVAELGLDHNTPIFICNLPFQHRFSTLDQGAYAFYEVMRRRPVLVDDTIMNIINNAGLAVEQTYYAMITAPFDQTQSQQEMIQDFVKVLGEIPDAPTVLLQVSHMVVKCVIQLASIGDNLRSDQIAKLAPTKQDQFMTAGQRLERLCEIFKHTKSICEDLLEGKDAIASVVAAPNACEQRKYGNNKTILSSVAMNSAPPFFAQQHPYEEDVRSLSPPMQVDQSRAKRLRPQTRSGASSYMPRMWVPFDSTVRGAGAGAGYGGGYSKQSSLQSPFVPHSSGPNLAAPFGAEHATEDEGVDAEGDEDVDAEGDEDVDAEGNEDEDADAQGDEDLEV